MIGFSFAVPTRISSYTTKTVEECSILPIDNITEEVHVLIRDKVNPALNSAFGSPCNCGGPEWTRVADLNMADTSETCPPNWQFKTTPNSIRGCENPSAGCHSASFPVDQTYSEVCGRIDAIQFGIPEALDNYIQLNYSIEQGYIDGISLTHGSQGSRMHIWSFLEALSERPTIARVICPCTNVNESWPYSFPSFIGNNYFCDTGNKGPDEAVYFTDDPLWNGQGCGPTSTCCQENNPPWFCAKLPSPASNDLEARICTNAQTTNENVLVTKIELYIK